MKNFCLFVLFIYAITFFVIDLDFAPMNWIRENIFLRYKFLKKLTNCYYCLGFHLAFIGLILYQLSLFDKIFILETIFLSFIVSILCYFLNIVECVLSGLVQKLESKEEGKSELRIKGFSNND